MTNFWHFSKWVKKGTLSVLGGYTVGLGFGTGKPQKCSSALSLWVASQPPGTDGLARRAGSAEEVRYLAGKAGETPPGLLDRSPMSILWTELHLDSVVMTETELSICIWRRLLPNETIRWRVTMKYVFSFFESCKLHQFVHISVFWLGEWLVSPQCWRPLDLLTFGGRGVAFRFAAEVSYGLDQRFLIFSGPRPRSLL